MVKGVIRHTHGFSTAFSRLFHGFFTAFSRLFQKKPYQKHFTAFFDATFFKSGKHIRI